MNIVTQVPPVTQVTRPVTVAPSAFYQFLAAETAAWDAYEAALAVAQEVQDSLVSAGSSVLKAYRSVQWRRDRACNALEAALATARAEYESPAKVNGGNVDVDTMSLSELEAAMPAAAPYGEVFDGLVAEWTARGLARVVTGDDGLDHYL